MENMEHSKLVFGLEIFAGRIKKKKFARSAGVAGKEIQKKVIARFASGAKSNHDALSAFTGLTSLK